MKKLLLILTTLVLLLTGCQKNEYQRFQQNTQTAGFDTTFTLLGYAKSESEFNEAFQLMHDEFLKYHEIFDNYHTYDGINNLKSINDAPANQPIKVDPVLIEALLLSKENFENSQGKFDPTIGALLEIWHDYREEGIDSNSENKPGRIPSLEELKQAKACTGWDKVIIDEANNTVTLTQDCMSLDLGGVAKGFAVEKVAQTLQEHGLQHFTINAGGNIRTNDKKPDGEPWKIGISKPSLMVLESIDIFSIDESMSVVTSGDYQRYYIGPDDVIYHHLIDPETMMPANYYRSASIITKDSGVADIYSTVIFLLDYPSVKEWITQHNETDPNNHIEAYFIIDQTSPYYDHEDFIKVPGTEFKVAMTEGLKPLSKVVNP